MNAADTPPGEPLFREVQRFRQLWVWLIVLVATGVSLWGFAQQVVFGVPFGNNPAPDWLLVLIAVLVGVGLPVLMLTATLTTEVRAGAVRVRFSPFHLRWRKFPLAELASHEARTYRPLREYGGWGIRRGLRSGWAFDRRASANARM